MNLLRDLSSAMRRVPSSIETGDEITPASLVQANGISTASAMRDRVLGSATVAPSAPSTAPPDGAAVVHRLRPSAGSPAAPADRSAREGAPTIYHVQGEQTAVLKAGQQHARWRNPFICHAMPAVLQLQRCLAAGASNGPTVRAQLALEVRLYRERLAEAACEPAQTRDASYLLCTYLDEAVSDAARSGAQVPYDGDRSLLVELHGDAWGGEDAFADLARWMKHDPLPRSLLALYELILALGWRGRYRVLERGDVLLQDLRSQLHALVWQGQAPEALGTALLAPAVRRQGWWTAGRAALVAVGAVALAYAVASFDLNARGRPVREALAAWTPPLRAINLAETLPPPLPQLLAEGWLKAYKHPQGWLLVFNSDGAFDVGKAAVKPEFVNNIERLGLAFAPWPGDLEVIGHTDRQPIQTSAFPSNQALSEARARTVAEELRQTAVPGGARAPANVVQRKIESSGRGDTEPVDRAQTEAAYERNRRVDVLWKVIQAGSVRRDPAVRNIMPEGVSIQSTRVQQP